MRCNDFKSSLISCIKKDNGFCLTSSLPMSALVLNVFAPFEDDSSVAELDILFTLICEGVKTYMYLT